MIQIYAKDDKGNEWKFEDVLLWGCWTKTTIEFMLYDEINSRDLDVPTTDAEVMLNEICDRVEANEEMVSGDCINNYIYDALEQWESEHKEEGQ